MVDKKIIVGIWMIVGLLFFGFILMWPQISFYWNYQEVDRISLGEFSYMQVFREYTFPSAIIYAATLNFLLQDEMNINETRNNWIIFGFVVLFLFVYGFIAHNAVVVDTVLQNKVVDPTYIRWGRVPLLLYLIGLSLYLSIYGKYTSKKIKLTVTLNASLFFVSTLFIVLRNGSLNIFGSQDSLQTAYRLIALDTFAHITLISLLSGVMVLVLGSILFAELFRFSGINAPQPDPPEYKL